MPPKESVLIRVSLTPAEWESFKRVASTKRLNASQFAGLTLRKQLPKGGTR